MDATPISVPANRFTADVDSLEIDEFIWLTKERTFKNFAFALWMLANVSAVSPLWEIATTSVSPSKMGFLYLNSDENSTSVIIFAKRSM